MIPSLDTLKQLDEIDWLYTTEDVGQKRNSSWSNELITEIDALANFLLRHPKAKEHAEIIALAFWFRKANLVQIKQSYCDNPAKDHVVDHSMSNGNVFHIAPANVDTVFFYSMILAVLAGHTNIVRLSQRSGEIVYVLVELLSEFFQLNSDSSLQYQIHLIQYSHECDEITSCVSHWCDLRVVWGGDNTIEAISSIAPDTDQICFPDRYSVAILSLNEYSDLMSVARMLMSDIEPFQQQACSSPKAILWLDTPDRIRTLFYSVLEKIVLDDASDFGLSSTVAQHTNVQSIALTHPMTVRRLNYVGKLLVVDVNCLEKGHLKQHKGNGLLLSSDFENWDFLSHAGKLQTVSHFGLDKLRITQLKVQVTNGEIKRLTRLGSALTFNQVWDGIDLCEVFSSVNQKTMDKKC